MVIVIAIIIIIITLLINIIVVIIGITVLTAIAAVITIVIIVINITMIIIVIIFTTTSICNTICSCFSNNFFVMLSRMKMPINFITYIKCSLSTQGMESSHVLCVGNSETAFCLLYLQILFLRKRH